MAPLPDPYTHPTMTLEEAAACLGISRSTAYRWTATGRGLPVVSVWPRRVQTLALYALLCRPLPARQVLPRVITLNPPE